jgi:hypothetical protein
MNAISHAEPEVPPAADTASEKTLRKRRMAREPKTDTNEDTTTTGQSSAEQSAIKPVRAQSKIAAVIALLERSEGATLDDIIEATGWLPHTTRAALTGLKKKGYTMTKSKREDVTCYFIAKPAP